LIKRLQLEPAIRTFLSPQDIQQLSDARSYTGIASIRARAISKEKEKLSSWLTKN